jgi:WD40 repeat protein
LLYDVAAGRERAVGRGHWDSVETLVFVDDNRKVVTVGSDKTVRSWDAASGRELRMSPVETWPGGFGPVLSADGRTAAFSKPGPLVTLVSTETGKPVAEFKVADQVGPSGLALAPDGRTFAAHNSIDQRTIIWDIVTGRKRLTIDGPNQTTRRLTFSPDGRVLAGGGSDGGAWLWDAASGRSLHVLKIHRWAKVDCLAFSPDGKVLVTCANGISDSTDHVIRLWDVATGRELCQFPGLIGDIRTLAFAPDGKTLASGGEDETIRLWDVATGRLTHQVAGQGGTVEVLRYSTDGRILAAANADTTVLLWDVSALPKVEAKGP